jgi:hypothetical protein
MAGSHSAAQMLDDALGVEMVTDKAEPPFRVEVGAIESHNTCRFLSTVLQGVKAQRRYGGGIGMTGHSEHTAFLMQLVVISGESGKSVQLFSHL